MLFKFVTCKFTVYTLLGSTWKLARRSDSHADWHSRRRRRVLYCGWCPSFRGLHCLILLNGQVSSDHIHFSCLNFEWIYIVFFFFSSKMMILLNSQFNPYWQEEIEIEAKVVGGQGKLVAFVVEIMRKSSGELIAIGKQWTTTKPQARSSRLWLELF